MGNLLVLSYIIQEKDHEYHLGQKNQNMSQVYKLDHVFVLMYELQVTKFYCEQSSYSHFIDSIRKILTLFSLDLRGIQYHHAGSKRADKEQLKNN